MELSIYNTGQRFIHEQYLNRGEITVAMLNTSFFDLVSVLSGITNSELQDFKTGHLTLYLYESGDVPYIIFKFGDWSMDVNINILKVGKEDREKWLNSESNTISLFLIEQKTGILKALRLISVPMTFSRKIKDICRKQTGQTMQDINNSIAATLQIVPSVVMMKDSIEQWVVR